MRISKHDLHKTAGYLSLAAKLGKWVDEVYQVAKPGLVRKLSDMWKVHNAGSVVEKEIPQVLTTISDDLTQVVKPIQQTLQKVWIDVPEIKTITTAAERALSQADLLVRRDVNRSISSVRRFEEELGKVNRAMSRYEKAGGEIPQKLQEDGFRVANSLNNARKDLKTIYEQQVFLRQFIDQASQDPLKALDYFQANSQKFTTLYGKGVADWARGIRQALMTEKTIYAPSKNLSNHAAFLNEYLTKKQLGGKQYERWLATPANFNKLEELFQSGRVAKLLQSGALRVPWSQRWFTGVTYPDLLKRLGLPVTVAAAGTAATAWKIMDWFGSTSDKTQKSNSLAAVVKNLKVKGEAQPITDTAEEALSNIYENTVEAKTQSQTDPGKAISTFVSKTGPEYTKLVNSINSWKTVVTNAEDPKQAVAVVKMLISYATSLKEQLQKLGATANISIEEPKTTLEKEGDIQQIQEFLGLSPTGQLDEPTTKKLQELEAKLNKIDGSTRFTGSFVSNNKLKITFNELINIIQRLKKY